MKRLAVLFSVFVTALLFAQRDYHFDYQSLYLSGADNNLKLLDSTRIYDNSKDASYQLFVYPDEAKLVDEKYNEIHYFKRNAENDSIVFKYDYSLKVFFQPDIKISSVNVKKINDIDYEISYIKDVDRKRSKHLLEICLQQSEENLLNTAFLDTSKKEWGTLVNHLKKFTNPDKTYYVHTVFNNNGRYRFVFERTELNKAELTVTVPKEKYYKNSFLKSK